MVPVRRLVLVTAVVLSLSPTVPTQLSAAATVDARATARERVLIGRSVEGRPIWAYRRGSPDAERVVVVLGQMHGDEPAGVVTARSIRDRLPVSNRADVWVVPTMNPDGLAAGTRNNARGVDLNRNWPTNWEPGSTSGSGPVSEPETRAMLRFLKRVEPTFVASMHQPFKVVGRSDKNLRYVRRLSRQLDLPIQPVGIDGCTGPDCPPIPTMTSWFNTRRSGTCVTIEFGENPGRPYLRGQAARGILRATFASRRARTDVDDSLGWP
jgi:hypothetical protein